MRVCEIIECGQKYHANGLCSKHNDRLRRTGDAKTPNQDRAEWNLDLVRKRMFHNAKKRAKDKGLPFSLGAIDISIPDICPVLGIPIQCGSGKFQDSSPSLDRIIPSLGYVPGNVRVISWRANRIKNDSTLEELEKLVRYFKNDQRVE